jgi:glutamyl-Q tRNA(Asp) synthetase
MDKPVFRFAPSPNGELHLGHAFSALVGYERACARGGRFLVRIEDIDEGRARARYVAGILADLAWLGLTWEEPVVLQSERLSAYPGLYKGRAPAEIAHRRAAGEPYALRLDMAAAIGAAGAKLARTPLCFVELDEADRPQMIEARPERWGDAVIVRKEAAASYHLAVVIDDAWQGISHVTRGRDLYAATDLHRLLQVLLDLPAPIYHHHRLITDTAGRKLAKSARDTSLRWLREQGVTPTDIRRLIGLA